jgi:hypothetical protein
MCPLNDKLSPEYSTLLSNVKQSHNRSEAESPTARKRSVSFKDDTPLVSTVPSQFLQKPKPPITASAHIKQTINESENTFLSEAQTREDMERAEIAAIADALIESRSLVAVPNSHDKAFSGHKEFLDEEEEESPAVLAAIEASRREAEAEKRREEDEMERTIREVMELSKVEEESEMEELLRRIREEGESATGGGSSSSGTKY